MGRKKRVEPNTSHSSRSSTSRSARTKRQAKSARDVRKKLPMEIDPEAKPRQQPRIRRNEKTKPLAGNSPGIMNMRRRKIKQMARNAQSVTKSVPDENKSGPNVRNEMQQRNAASRRKKKIVH